MQTLPGWPLVSLHSSAVIALALPSMVRPSWFCGSERALTTSAWVLPWSSCGLNDEPLATAWLAKSMNGIVPAEPASTYGGALYFWTSCCCWSVSLSSGG